MYNYIITIHTQPCNDYHEVIAYNALEAFQSLRLDSSIYDIEVTKVASYRLD